ncbi:hypothetical protein [Mycoplasma zalophidermidis]|uniref:KOW domain-containing protein n=1 Tax=Mycoplasma zalophidermidis TaxID=398174 RepID=A0ABS6DR08_9MOLU|nr:hypothetical protein [Mycoplasma zalophidermidis]MBU4693435.1 hypothetical protein [Mycoplasma zalophidermidis]MCR8966879.1 hypothetical protein [Mycoplasma zalophidermidis]
MITNKYTKGSFYRIRGRKGSYSKALGASIDWDVVVDKVETLKSEGKWTIIEVERCKVIKSFKVGKNEKNI